MERAKWTSQRRHHSRILLACLAGLLFALPALAVDTDGDGVDDTIDTA